MSFANFYVSEPKINKQFKGCYRTTGPEKGTVGKISGSWQPSPIYNIVPYRNLDDPGLWVFGANAGSYVKMVGMKYGEGSGPPRRIDGRAFETFGFDMDINQDSLTYFWRESQIKGIRDGEYTLTISNNSPLLSIGGCMDDAVQSGNNIFAVTNLNRNDLGRCVTGRDADMPPGTLLSNVGEEECLKNSGAATVYNVESSGDKDNTLGKTYLGEKDSGSENMVFHEYPSSLLAMGKDYIKHADYNSPDNNLMDAEITNASSEQCKQFCINRGQDCKGFVYDKVNKSCMLKNEIYPTSKRTMNKTTDIYTRMPEVKNNVTCPSGVTAVDTGFLKNNGFMSSEQMSLDFKCETEAEVLEEENLMNISNNFLTQEFEGLRDENQRLIDAYREVRYDASEVADDYVDTIEQISKLKKENPTVSKLLDDAEQLGTSYSMVNTWVVLGLILLSIFLLRVLRK